MTKARLAERHAAGPERLDERGTMLEASHFDANTAYAAVDRHRLDDYEPYIYATHDAGKTWTVGDQPASRPGVF